MRYFSAAGLRFLRALERNNERGWFHAHREQYEQHIREPFQALLGDLQPALARLSPHFHADPARTGGSLYRVNRDTRYSHDKSPYKTWQGARLYHDHRRLQPCPGFFIRFRPGQSFVAAGLWRHDTATQRRVRQFIFDNPGTWGRIVFEPAFARRYRFVEEDRLARPPRGFPADFAYIEHLRLRDFVARRGLDDATMTGPRLRNVLERDLRMLAPLVDYLCAALELEF